MIRERKLKCDAPCALIPYFVHYNVFYLPSVHSTDHTSAFLALTSRESNIVKHFGTTHILI